MEKYIFHALKKSNKIQETKGLKPPAFHTIRQIRAPPDSYFTLNVQ